MSREITEPTTNKHGDEVHPSFGLISANRVSAGPPGVSLFDSEIRHQHFITVRIATASRKRDLNRDWLHRDEEFVEIEMSESQWASFVSSMNSGSGVPCTITRREDDLMVPSAPYVPRMEHSMNEVRGAAQDAMERVKEAFAAYKEKKNAANLRDLEIAVGHVEPNMVFAAESLTEHAENVVQKAKADIEAMVTARAQQLGLTEDQAKELMPG
jgi:hypothetical protein